MMRYPTLDCPLAEEEAWAVERHGFFGWINVSGSVAITHTLDAAVKLVGEFASMDRDFNDRMKWPMHGFRIRNKKTGEIISGDIIVG